jgi:hypothetical protein
MQTKKTKRLPVFAEYVGTDESHDPVVTPATNLGIMSFWMLVIVGVFGLVGLRFGWFESPSQATVKENLSLQKQLSEVRGENSRIKGCVNQ